MDFFLSNLKEKWFRGTQTVPLALRSYLNPLAFHLYTKVKPAVWMFQQREHSAGDKCQYAECLYAEFRGTHESFFFISRDIYYVNLTS